MGVFHNCAETHPGRTHQEWELHHHQKECFIIHPGIEHDDWWKQKNAGVKDYWARPDKIQTIKKAYPQRRDSGETFTKKSGNI